MQVDRSTRAQADASIGGSWPKSVPRDDGRTRERIRPPSTHPEERRLGRRRRLAGSALAAVVALVAIAGWSLAGALTAPGAASLPARAAEWARTHGGAGLVGWIENEWYSHHPPRVGGRPPKGAIPSSAAASHASGSTGALPPPAPIPPLAQPPVSGEGQWNPIGRQLFGVPTMYAAYLRPDAVHTSLVAGVVWMDSRLLRFRLFKGSAIPGHGPWRRTAPVSSSAAARLAAAFNGGFRLADSGGGYYSEGRAVAPLVSGAASLIIYRDGTATVGQWGRDAQMSPAVSSVRQNLDLIVDGGRPVSSVVDGASWGATIGNRVYVWRSGLGVTADGALLYACGPGLDAASLADLLARAGAVRAMELDINTDWVNFTDYTPSTPGAPASPADGRTLLPTMRGGAGRYFAPWWNRDFVTASVR